MSNAAIVQNVTAWRKEHALVQRMDLGDVKPTAATARACRCGELVYPDRVTVAWVFYCQQCGADWTEPAPRRNPTRTKCSTKKRCACTSKCHSCGGERRR